MLGILRGHLTQLRQRTDMEFSRQVFGNPAGFSHNVVSGLDLGLRRLRQRLSMQGVGAASPAARLRKEGVYVFEHPSPVDAVRPVAQKFASMIEDDRFAIARASAPARHKDLFYSRILRDARCLLPELASLLDSHLQEVVAQYFGGSFAVLDVLAWRNYGPQEEAPEGVELFSDYWHCDRISPRILKFFILLEPVGERKGPLHILRRQPTRRFVRDRSFLRARFRLLPNAVGADYDVIKLTGPIGSRALCNTAQCLHRAGRPAPGETRDILQIQFQPADQPFELSSLARTKTDFLEEKYKTRRQVEP